MHLECLRCILFPQPGFILLAPNWKRSNACCFSAGLQTSNQRWLILSYPTYPIDTQSQNKPLDFLSVTIADSEGSVHTMSTLQKHWYMNPLSPSWPQILANKALNTTLFCQCWWLVLVPFSGLRQAQRTRIDQEYRHPGIHNFKFTTIRQTVRWHMELAVYHGGLAGWMWNHEFDLTWLDSYFLWGPIWFRRHLR